MEARAQLSTRQIPQTAHGWHFFDKRAHCFSAASLALAPRLTGAVC